MPPRTAPPPSAPTTRPLSARCASPLVKLLKLSKYSSTRIRRWRHRNFHRRALEPDRRHVTRHTCRLPPSRSPTIWPSHPITSLTTPTIFVGQHYHDFLNRQATPVAWLSGPARSRLCGADAVLHRSKRINVSTAFFLSIEFQQTGYLVFRIYKETFTDSLGPTARHAALPRVPARHAGDRARRRGRAWETGKRSWQQTSWILRSAGFRARSLLQSFPCTMTAEQFVDKLFLNAEVTPTAGRAQRGHRGFRRGRHGRTRAGAAKRGGQLVGLQPAIQPGLRADPIHRLPAPQPERRARTGAQLRWLRLLAEQDEPV